MVSLIVGDIFVTKYFTGIYLGVSKFDSNLYYETQKYHKVLLCRNAVSHLEFGPYGKKKSGLGLIPYFDRTWLEETDGYHIEVS